MIPARQRQPIGVVFGSSAGEPQDRFLLEEARVSQNSNRCKARQQKCRGRRRLCRSERRAATGFTPTAPPRATGVGHTRSHDRARRHDCSQREGVVRLADERRPETRGLGVRWPQSGRLLICARRSVSRSWCCACLWWRLCVLREGVACRSWMIRRKRAGWGFGVLLRGRPCLSGPAAASVGGR